MTKLSNIFGRRLDDTHISPNLLHPQTLSLIPMQTTCITIVVINFSLDSCMGGWSKIYGQPEKSIWNHCHSNDIASSSTVIPEVLFQPTLNVRMVSKSLCDVLIVTIIHNNAIVSAFISRSVKFLATIKLGYEVDHIIIVHILYFLFHGWAFALGSCFFPHKFCRIFFGIRPSVRSLHWACSTTFVAGMT